MCQICEAYSFWKSFDENPSRIAIFTSYETLVWFIQRYFQFSDNFVTGDDEEICLIILRKMNFEMIIALRCYHNVAKSTTPCANKIIHF